MDRSEIQLLVTAAADGDRAAVEPLFRALWLPLVRYAERLVGSLAEDVVQDALARMFSQLDRFDRDRDALTWAFTHVTWQARTVRRSVDRRRDDGAMPQHSVSPDYEDRDLIRAALAELDQLSPRDRDVIAAKIFDEPIPTATLRKRLERALARLRTSWRSRHGTL